MLYYHIRVTYSIIVIMVRVQSCTLVITLCMTLTWLCTCRNPPKLPGTPPAGAEGSAGALVGSAVGRVAEVVMAGVLSVVASCIG